MSSKVRSSFTCQTLLVKEFRKANSEVWILDGVFPLPLDGCAHRVTGINGIHLAVEVPREDNQEDDDENGQQKPSIAISFFTSKHVDRTMTML